MADQYCTACKRAVVDRGTDLCAACSDQVDRDMHLVELKKSVREIRLARTIMCAMRLISRSIKKERVH